jgi:hypothetical protein
MQVLKFYAEVFRQFGAHRIQFAMFRVDVVDDQVDMPAFPVVMNMEFDATINSALCHALFPFLLSLNNLGGKAPDSDLQEPKAVLCQ